MKKLKFKDFFLKKTIVSIIIATVICLVILGAGFYVAKRETDISLEYDVLQTISRIKDYENHAADPVNAAIFQMAMVCDSNVLEDIKVDRAMLLMGENGKKIASSEFNCFAAISSKNTQTGKNEYYYNKSEDFKKLLTELDENIYIDFSEIYTDGYGFYPGKTTITETSEGGLLMPDGEVMEYDFTPENTEGLKVYESDIIEIIAGTKSESDVLAYVINPSHYSGTKKTMHGGDYFLQIEDKEYTLRAFHYFDFWGFFGLYFVIGTVFLISVSVLISYIKARKQYEKYCTQYEIDEYRRNMTNALAHDLKSPLTAIYGYAENLKNNVHSEKKDYYADAVLENVQYMNEIITNTLDLAKLEISDKGLKREKVDISVLAEELYSKYRPQAESRDISFKISGKAVVSADRKMMIQAVENLISNAVKYTSDGGEIKICVNAESFVISNTTDKVIDAEKVNKPFEKADASRSNRSGSGIGLSIIRNIMMLHKFGFETKAENNTFTAKITF